MIKGKDAVLFTSSIMVIFLPFLLPLLSISSFTSGDINISGVQHLTSDYILISDITEQVQNKDDSWSEQINSGDVIRVTYQSNLTNGNVIDVYAKGNCNPYFDITLPYNTNPLATSKTFNPYASWNYIVISGLQQPADTFDFRINGHEGSSIQFDYIHDAAPTQGTPILNSNLGTNTTVENLTVYNISTADGDGDSVKNIINWYKGGATASVINMPFERSGTHNATDYSGLGNNGSVSGPTWLASGGYDEKGAFSFDGINDYISFDPYELPYGISKRTMEAWVNLASEPSGVKIVLSYGQISTGRIWELGFNTDTVFISNYGSSVSTYTVELAPYVGQWVYLAVNYDGSNQTLYFNGAQVATGSVELLTAQSGASIGRSYDGSYPFNGTIDEVRIYNYSFSAEEILAHYNNL